MKVTDTSAIVNELYKEMVGTSDIAAITNENIVDVGRTMITAGRDVLHDKICDKVGRFVVLNHTFTLKFPRMMRNSWEWGAIMETLRVKPLIATTDPSYRPQKGQKYDSFLTYDPVDVTVKYFEDYDNFQITHWKSRDQLWGAFKSMEDLTRYFTAIEIEQANALNMRLQSLAKTAVNNMICQTLHKDFAEGNYGSNSTLRCVNILKLYKTANPSTTITAEDIVRGNIPEDEKKPFYKMFVKEVLNTKDRLGEPSTLYNIDGEVEMVNDGDLAVVMLSTFAHSIEVDMESDVYHNELVKLPEYSTVPYFQGSGLNYDPSVISEVEMTIKTGESTTASVEATGLLGIMYDIHAVGLNCEKRTTTSFFNPDINQTQFQEKYLGQYYNDFSRPFVVFYAADENV